MLGVCGGESRESDRITQGVITSEHQVSVITNL